MEDEIRLSSIINTFGPGSLIDLKEISVVGMGMEYWINNIQRNYSGIPNFLKIKENRLRNELKHKFPSLLGFIQLIPELKIIDGKIRLSPQNYPVRVFPEWVFCTECRRFGPYFQLKLSSIGGKKLNLWDTPYYCKHCFPKYNDVKVTPKLVASRFVRICKEGHLDDIAWNYLAHFPKPPCSSNLDLYLRVKGVTSGLEDLYVECNKCKQNNDLSQVFEAQSPLNQGYCTGRNPEIGVKPSIPANKKPKCPERMKTILKGATNAYFTRAHSALSFPSDLDKLQDWQLSLIKLLEEYKMSLSADNAKIIHTMLNSKYPDMQFPSIDKMIAFKMPEEDSEDNIDIKKFELRSLISDKYFTYKETHGILVTEKFDLPDNQKIKGLFQKIVVLPRLREVSVLYGFNRLQNKGDMYTQLVADEEDEQNTFTNITKFPYNVEYLPGVEYFGEGIFFQLNRDTIRKWSTNSLFNRRYIKFSEDDENRYRPEDILTHSLSHAMIVGLSEVSGYSASALKERLYINIKKDERAYYSPGFLIYTATPDSEGSLGGLIQVIKSGKLLDVIERMIDNMRWCSSDPVCIENKYDENSMFKNHASCHACLFIPETACEHNNQYLDRATLVGTSGLENRKQGVFYQIE